MNCGDEKREREIDQNLVMINFNCALVPKKL